METTRKQTEVHAQARDYETARITMQVVGDQPTTDTIHMSERRR